MLILDMSIECRIAEVSLATDADIVPLHRVITGSSLPSGDKLLLTFVEVHVFLGLAHEMNDNIRKKMI